jgi:hypothetical protein
MNYLYFIFMTLILSVSSLVTSTRFENTKDGGWYEFFIGLGVLSAIITLIILIISIGNTLSDKQSFRSKCNSIRKLRKDIDNIDNEIRKYKTEFKEIITEMYPQYEKEVFKNMQPQDAESLTMIMVKYPELKFDGVLNGYVNKINALFDKIMDKQYYITDYYKEAKDIQEDKWLFGVIEFPSDIENN